MFTNILVKTRTEHGIELPLGTDACLIPECGTLKLKVSGSTLDLGVDSKLVYNVSTPVLGFSLTA